MRAGSRRTATRGRSGTPAAGSTSRTLSIDERRYAPTVVTPSTDDAIVAGVRSGDEAVFAQLLDDWSRSMLLLARTFVFTEASAEEVVQDTWLAVIEGIDRFEGRSSVRTWVYRILANTAQRRGSRERRVVPLSGPIVFRGLTNPFPGTGGNSRPRGRPARRPSPRTRSSPPRPAIGWPTRCAG